MFETSEYVQIGEAGACIALKEGLSALLSSYHSYPMQCQWRPGRPIHPSIERYRIYFARRQLISALCVCMCMWSSSHQPRQQQHAW